MSESCECVSGWICGQRPSQRQGWRQRRHERVRNVTAPTHPSRFGGRSSRLPSPESWSSPAVPAAASAGSTDEPAPTASRIMVAQANDADDFYAQMAAAYTEETGVGDRSDPLPLRRVQHAGHDAAAGRQRRRRADPLPGNGPADLGDHARRCRLPRAARRHLSRCDPRGHRVALRGRRRDLRTADLAVPRRLRLQPRCRRRGRRRRVPGDVRRPAGGVHDCP